MPGSSELSIFIASLNSNKTKVPTLSIEVELDCALVAPALTLASLTINEYRMEKSTSVYDMALAELRRQNATASAPLLQWNDDEVYNLGQMATPMGLAVLQNNLSKFESMQAASLRPQAFHGKTSIAAGGVLRLSLQIETPAAVVLWLHSHNVHLDDVGLAGIGDPGS